METENLPEVSHSGYADPSPYPEIRVLSENRYYADILMDSYAGQVSEFTAINQYLYHYFVLKETAEDVAKMLERVSITEMHHMEILAETILLLGGNPVYRAGAGAGCAFWHAGFVYYGCRLCDRLHENLKSERKAIFNYERTIERIHDPHVRAILRRIILDEELHIELFKKAIAAHCG